MEAAARQGAEAAALGALGFPGVGPPAGGRAAPPSHCLNCGTARTETPTMRSGPHGPRTLCNACGLVWKKHGRLRDIKELKNCGRGAKRRRELLQEPSLEAGQGSYSGPHAAATSSEEHEEQHREPPRYAAAEHLQQHGSGVSTFGLPDANEACLPPEQPLWAAPPPALPTPDRAPPGRLVPAFGEEGAGAGAGPAAAAGGPYDIPAAAAGGPYDIPAAAAGGPYDIPAAAAGAYDIPMMWGEWAPNSPPAAPLPSSPTMHTPLAAHPGPMALGQSCSNLAGMWSSTAGGPAPAILGGSWGGPAPAPDPAPAGPRAAVILLPASQLQALLGLSLPALLSAAGLGPQQAGPGVAPGGVGVQMLGGLPLQQLLQQAPQAQLPMGPMFPQQMGAAMGPGWGAALPQQAWGPVHFPGTPLQTFSYQPHQYWGQQQQQQQQQQARPPELLGVVADSPAQHVALQLMSAGQLSPELQQFADPGPAASPACEQQESMFRSVSEFQRMMDDLPV